jgi:hypothetical protein
MDLGRRLAKHSIVLLACAGSAIVLPTAIHGQTTELARFVGRDFWRHQPSTNEALRLNQIVGKIPKGQVVEPGPWHIWKTHRSTQTRYVVLLGEPLILIPGGSSVCIQLFDVRGKRLNSWSFLTGWRLTLQEASIEFSSDLMSDVIVLKTARVVNGPNITREYFALSNDRLRFVRMENDKGIAVQNEYIFPNQEIGIVPAINTVDEWASLLESKDKADVLSALVFLGGRHLTEPERHFASEPQGSKWAGLFQQLVGSPLIRGLITRLSNSDDQWVRQAALLATRGPRERLFQ